MCTGMKEAGRGGPVRHKAKTADSVNLSPEDSVHISFVIHLKSHPDEKLF